MRSFLLAIALAAVLAGCANPPKESATAASVNQTAAPPPAVANAAPVGTNATDPVRVPYAFKGDIPAYAETCAWTVVQGLCADTPSDFSKIRDSPKLGGAPLGGTIVASRQSAAPTNDKLALAMFSYDDQGHFKSYGAAEGSSPLTLHPKGFPVPAGQTLFVGLFPVDDVNVGDGPLWARATHNAVDQPFALQGWFDVQPSSSAT